MSLKSQGLNNKIYQYDDTYKTSYDSWKGASAEYRTDYMQVGASLGWNWWSKLGGAAIGAVADYFAWDSRVSDAKEKAKGDLRNRSTAATNAFNGAMQSRKDLRTQSLNFINTTRSSFDSTFGANSYDMMNSLVTAALGNGTMDQFIQAMQASTGIENSGSLNGVLELMSDEQREALMTGRLSINDINDSYYNFLSEYFGQQNTQFGYQMRQLSDQERYLNEQANSAMSSIRDEYAQQIESAVAQQQMQNISGAESLGSTEAQAGASGIRQTGKGNNATILQKYETILSSVMFASTLQYTLNKYENDLKNTQSGYMYQAYQLRNSMNASVQQQIANYVEQSNKAQNGLADMIYKIESADRDAMAAIAEYEAVNKALADIEAEEAAAKARAEEYKQKQLNKVGVAKEDQTVTIDMNEYNKDKGQSDSGTTDGKSDSDEKSYNAQVVATNPNVTTPNGSPTAAWSPSGSPITTNGGTNSNNTYNAGPQNPSKQYQFEGEEGTGNSSGTNKSMTNAEKNTAMNEIADAKYGMTMNELYKTDKKAWKAIRDQF